MIELTVTAENAEGLADELRKLADRIAGVVEAEVAPTEDLRETSDPEPEPEKTAEIGPRLFGKTEDGKTRRTKAQMAEDDEIAELANKHSFKVTGDSPATETLATLREMDAQAVEETTPEPEAEAEPAAEPEISKSPEDRQDPNVEVFTPNDLKAAMMRFKEEFGMAKTQKDLPAVLGYPKLSAVPDDSEVIGGIIAKIDEAILNA